MKQPGIGQIWKDNDPRMRRSVRILDIFTKDGNQYAEVRECIEATGEFRPFRKSRVRFDTLRERYTYTGRFVDSANGLT